MENNINNTVEVEKTKFKIFLDFLVVSFNGMAIGLFSTLIIGVIIEQIGVGISYIPYMETLSEYIVKAAVVLKSAMGIGIGIGMAYALKQEGLKLVVIGLAGGIASSFAYLGTNIFGGKALNDPLTVYLVVVGVYLFFKFIFNKKTPVDIILIPLFGSVVALILTFILGFPIKSITTQLGVLIDIVSKSNIGLFFVGMIVSVLMGMALTAPISSAAIAIAINLEGLAGGAAVVGCCVQMLGFAVMSRKDNKIGTIIGVAIGTSMLQFKNIIKKPIIWLPTIIVSAVLGPLSTLLFKMETNAIGAGMGTSGLVGQIGTFAVMGYNMKAFLIVLVLQIILPIVLVYILDLIFRKKGLIVPGDLTI